MIAFPWDSPTTDRGVQFGLWPYVDARDAARACCLAVEANTVGHETLILGSSQPNLTVDFAAALAGTASGECGDGDCNGLHRQLIALAVSEGRGVPPTTAQLMMS